jgi:hypothetical protein
VEQAADSAGEALAETAEAVVDDPVGAYESYLDATVGDTLRTVGEGLGENAGAMLLSAEQLYVDVRTKGVKETVAERVTAEVEAVAADLETVGASYKGMGEAVVEGDLGAVPELWLQGKTAAYSLAERFVTRGAPVKRAAGLATRAPKPAPALAPPAAATPKLAGAPAAPKALPPAKSVKPDVPLHNIFTALTKGPPIGSRSRGYNRRSQKYQQMIDRARRWWGGPGPVPAISDFVISHIQPLFGTRPGQKARVRAETATENTARSRVEKQQAKARREESQRQGLDPSDPANPLFVRPPRKP